mmetsp:Transcript_38908/g.51297  ORF Transcript_38908/g.51297 Transcript_38908/m.51297 type:complete len:82 (+) Transcript_38908:271-516(+)
MMNIVNVIENIVKGGSLITITEGEAQITEGVQTEITEETDTGKEIVMEGRVIILTMTSEERGNTEVEVRKILIGIGYLAPL